jgi:hypothetical protein
VNPCRRPLRLITPGIYTTFDGSYRVENTRVATGDPTQPDTWEIYLQHEPGVSIPTLDQHATLISGEHRTLNDATDTLATIYGKNLVSACVKECACTPVPVEQLRPGQLVDLEGDPFADQYREHRRYEWEFMEVIETERKSPGCIRVAFAYDTIGFPPTHIVQVLNTSDADPRLDTRQGAQR